jgi:hypothetical protein
MTVHWPGAMQDHLLARGCPRTRQVSPENPTGHRNEGARAVPDPDDPDLPHSAMAARLGRGFKVRPFISLAAGERRTIAALEGAGVITGLYLTSNLPDLRDLRLRIWWDGDAAAAVDVTVASFFCLGGRGQSHSVTSAMINVGPVRGCSSAWVMPYRQGARLELENTGPVRADVVAYKATYQEHDPLAVPGCRFRASTRSGAPDPSTAEFTLLEAPGAGMITGTSVSWLAIGPRWWGEGEVKVYLGDDQFPTLVDTGTEDYFGGAWGFRPGHDIPVGWPGRRAGLLRTVCRRTVHRGQRGLPAGNRPVPLARQRPDRLRGRRAHVRSGSRHRAGRPVRGAR